MCAHIMMAKATLSAVYLNKIDLLKYSGIVNLLRSHK